MWCQHPRLRGLADHPPQQRLPRLAQNNLQYKQGQLEMEAQQGIVMGPTVKPNFVAMAKAASKDKDSIQNSLNNLFQLIGDLLQGGYQR